MFVLGVLYLVFAFICEQRRRRHQVCLLCLVLVARNLTEKVAHRELVKLFMSLSGFVFVATL